MLIQRFARDEGYHQRAKENYYYITQIYIDPAQCAITLLIVIIIIILIDTT
jgi:hypothetical protein